MQCSSQHPAEWDLLSRCSPAVLKESVRVNSIQRWLSHPTVIFSSPLVKAEMHSYQQRWSGHFQQPSWVGSSLRHQHCWPERCGSAAAGDTLHGQWRLLHVVGSCKKKNQDQNKAHFLISYFLIEAAITVTCVFISVCIPVFTVFGIDNGRAQCVYQHLSSTFVVMDPKEEKRAQLFHLFGGSVLTRTDRNRRQLKILHSAVEGAERIAFGLVKNLLFQQNLHARIMTCRRESMNHHQLSFWGVHNQGS